MKITFNLEQHGSRAVFCSTLMMPWKQTIRMKDDRTVQSVLTPGSLCPASCYCSANSIFPGSIVHRSKKTSSERKDPWGWSWEWIQKLHHISCKRKGVWKNQSFQELWTAGQTLLMLVWCWRQWNMMWGILKKKESECLFRLTSCHKWLQI